MVDDQSTGKTVRELGGDVAPERGAKMHDIPKIIQAQIIQVTVEPFISRSHFVAQGAAHLVEHCLFGQLGPHLLASVGGARLLLAPFFSAGHIVDARVPALV